MSFGNILGQILQDGLGGKAQTRDRAGSAAQNLGAGGGFDQILGQLQGALSSRGVNTSGVGDLAQTARDFLGQTQAGGLSGAQLGGIGAAAGALFGGGLKGAARGGALAVLGTLALGALKNAQAQKTGGAVEDVQPQEIEAVTGPGAERILLRAMIAAAAADGEIDQAEMQKIVGKLDADEITDEERAFVSSEIGSPASAAAIAAEVDSPALAAEVYAASLLAISVDSDIERAYLSDLASELGLDAATVSELHRVTGAPQA